jgi:NTP pyrophosphatase (non-canonical NTP hydrolase)
MNLDSRTTIQTLKELLREFRDERDWKKFHDPKNLAEAISIEAAELLELFLWKNPFLKHIGDPEQALLHKVQNCVDESTDAPSSGKERTTVWIFARLFWPVLLGDIEFGPMIVYRDRDYDRAICLHGKVMVVRCSHSVFLSFAFVAND